MYSSNQFDTCETVLNILQSLSEQMVSMHINIHFPFCIHYGLLIKHEGPTRRNSTSNESRGLLTQGVTQGDILSSMAL